MAFPFPNPMMGGQQPAPNPMMPPRVPWASNPMITMAGLSLLGGRNLNDGLSNLAQTAPAGMAAKAGMQQFMLAQQERQAAKAEQDARRAQMNDVIKNWSGLSPEQRSLFMADPGAFSQYAVSTMTPPEPTDDLREYNFAKSQGFGGSFQDWQIAMKKAGAPSVSVDNVGTIPQGYELVTAPATGAKRMQPIPGGPADTSKKDTARVEQVARTGDVVLADIREAKKRVQEAPWYDPGAGFGAETIAGNVGGSTAADVQALLNTISSSVAFDRLQQMREASPTGGALGAVSDTELRLLRDTLGSIAQSQSKDQFVRNLDRLEQIYIGVMRKAAAYPNAADFGFAGAEAGGAGWTEVEPGIRIREKP